MSVFISVCDFEPSVFADPKDFFFSSNLEKTED